MSWNKLVECKRYHEKHCSCTVCKECGEPIEKEARVIDGICRHCEDNQDLKEEKEEEKGYCSDCGHHLNEHRVNTEFQPYKYYCNVKGCSCRNRSFDDMRGDS